MRRITFGFVAAVIMILGVQTAGWAEESVIPADSGIGKAPDTHQRLLLNAMEPGGFVHKGAWKMKNTYTAPAENVQPKFGQAAMALGAEEAEIAGAKGDFSVHEYMPGQASKLGMWVYLPKDANVRELGFQVRDAEGEALFCLVPADWTGWKWVEADLTDGSFKQAYKQNDKSGKVDSPIKSTHIAWFTKAPGKSELIVDSVVGLTRLDNVRAPGVTVDIAAPDRVALGKTVPASVFVTNLNDKPVTLTVDYSLQQASSLSSTSLPDPIFGSNHAGGVKSWIEAGGEVLPNSNLSTDGKTWTDPGTKYGKSQTEAFQYIDLGKVREIKKFDWKSGDANHSWLVDVSASTDGKNFTPVEGLQNVNHYKKWGVHHFPIQKPFKARVLKLRFHTPGGKGVNVIRMPAEYYIYDGTDDEKVEIPSVGSVIDKGRTTVTVPARSFSMASLPMEKPISAGAYFLGLDVKGPGVTLLSGRYVFAALRDEPSLINKDSRFAMNTSRLGVVPKLKRLGIGWVRFENGKWPFVSPAPHEYAFDGSVAPWHVDMDDIFKTYKDAGFSTLTYMFLTPKWCSDIPEGGSEKYYRSYPPKPLSLYGEFCFQMAARYGNTKVPAEKLLTKDKKTGLGYVKYYEMWNEPNLNPSPKATWGGWAAPMDKYYEMMRYGAEAVKKADPTAVVTSAGYAGMRAEMVNRLRTYKYPDGKCPLDFVEVINVHYYSGLQEPEIATKDGNANVTSSSTFPEDLQELNAWRDKYAPKMPIWMTETGYDSDGSFGTNETLQAARLPRVVMLCLAFGVEKVFVYREIGSTPSKHACSGVLRNDGSYKPSWFTFGTLIRQFKNVKGGAKRLPTADKNVWLMEWNNGGKPLLTAWCVEGTGELEVELGECTVTDAFGGVRAVKSTKGMKLTNFPTYISDVKNTEGLKTLRNVYEKQEAEKKARREKITALKKYLFDFGKPSQTGSHTLEGVKTPFVGVGKNALWSEEKGYGFNKSALREDDRTWMGRYQLVDRDSVRIRGGDHVFKFKAAEGEYDFAIRMEPFGGADGTVTITGADTDPVTLKVDSDSKIGSAKIKVSKDAILSVSIPKGYGTLCWIRCVETLK